MVITDIPLSFGGFYNCKGEKEMNEFEVIIKPEAGSIQTNFNEVKSQLIAEMSAFEGMEVTESNLSDSKKDLAFLRKVKKSINDKKVDIKKQYMMPYSAFETECKNMMAIIDKPIDELDKQIKAFDEKRVANKKQELKKLYEENIDDCADFIPFENTLEDSWSNISYKDKDYLFRLSELKVKVHGDLNIIVSLNSDIQEELISTYKNSNNDLSAAIRRNKQYLADKQRVQEQAKEQAKQEMTFEKPEPIQQLNDFIQMTKTVKIIINADDLQRTRNVLDFAEIKYEILEGK